MYHEYVSPNSRFLRRHYNGQRSSRFQAQEQFREYTDPDSIFWKSLAEKNCDNFHDLPGMTAPVYETFIQYLELDGFHGKTWKEISYCFQDVIKAFLEYPEASAEALAWCAGVLPEEFRSCNGANQDNCRYCAGIAQAVELEMKPCPKKN